MSVPRVSCWCSADCTSEFSSPPDVWWGKTVDNLTKMSSSGIIILFQGSLTFLYFNYNCPLVLFVCPLIIIQWIYSLSLIVFQLSQFEYHISFYNLGGSQIFCVVKDGFELLISYIYLPSSVITTCTICWFIHCWGPNWGPYEFWARSLLNQLHPKTSKNSFFSFS